MESGRENLGNMTDYVLDYYPLVNSENTVFSLGQLNYNMPAQFPQYYS